MRNPLARGFLVFLIGIGAIGVCFIGYRVNANRIYDQKVAYAESTIKSSTQTLANIDKEAAAIYTDDSQQIFAEGVNSDTVNQLLSKASAVQTSAESFDLDKKNLPDTIESLDKDKSKLLQQLRSAVQKFNLQDKVAAVFSNGISSWQAAADDVIIKEDLTTDSLTNIQSEVSEQEDGAWKNIANQYISFANNQLKQISDIQTALDNFMKDGALTADVTYDDYNSIVNNISQVRNETLRSKLSAQADQLKTLIDNSVAAAATAAANANAANTVTDTTVTE